MVEREQLYDAFGELIYAITKVDGKITANEINTFQDLLSDHPGAKEINWSFNFEKDREHSVEAAYQKALDICKENGPDREYINMIEILDAVSASDGIKNEETELIKRFIEELRSKFLVDFEKGM